MNEDHCDTGKGIFGTKSIDTYVLDNVECEPLANFIMHHINQFAKNTLSLIYEEMHFTQSWVSTKKPGQKHTYHTHPNSIVSGAFYWQEGPIEPIGFEKQRSPNNLELLRNFDNRNDFACDYYYVTPRQYTLILFPSYLSHGVDPNSQNESRKSLAFNTMASGSLGSEENLTALDLNRLINKRQAGRLL